MSESKSNRREFLATLSAVGGASMLMTSTGARPAQAADAAKELAINGGKPVRDSVLQYHPYGPQFYDDIERKELLDVLESRAPFRWYGGGTKVLQFEQAYSKHLGVKHALGVMSGTTALLTALSAMGVGPGDEVILPAWTWYADYDTIVMTGALPVFAEIDESIGIDPSDIEHRITPRTKVIIPSNLQGCVADMDSVMEIARKHKLLVLEDFSQCIGGRYHGKYLGSMGDMGINSFQLSKTITSGEGGAVVSSNPTLFERAIRFHDVGTVRPPYSEEFKDSGMPGFTGCNFRMNEFTGAVLKGQEQKLDAICSGLRANTKKVLAGITDLPGIKLRKSNDPEGDIGAVVFLDHGTRERRDQFLRALRAEGISASGPAGSAILPVDERIENKRTAHPDWPTFNTPQGKAIQYGAASCPKTIDIIDRLGGVVMDPTFTEADCNDIIAAIRKVYLALNA